jgi:hypothetical protein
MRIPFPYPEMKPLDVSALARLFPIGSLVLVEVEISFNPESVEGNHGLPREYLKKIKNGWGLFMPENHRRH